MYLGRGVGLRRASELIQIPSPSSSIHARHQSTPLAKRNLGALKSSPIHGRREKRQISVSDVDENMDQVSPVDYDELMTALESNDYPVAAAAGAAEKRFLGK